MASAPISPGVLRVGDRILRPRRARAHDEGGAALDDLLGEGRQGESLLGGLRVVFPGGAADDDAVNARGDQALEHVGELGPVDLASRPEGRDGRCVDAFELHVSAPICDAPHRRSGKCPTLVLSDCPFPYQQTAPNTDSTPKLNIDIVARLCTSTTARVIAAIDKSFEDGTIVRFVTSEFFQPPFSLVRARFRWPPPISHTIGRLSTKSMRKKYITHTAVMRMGWLYVRAPSVNHSGGSWSPDAVLLATF